MDSVDVAVAITIFFLLYMSFQQFFTPIESIPYMYDPFFLCSAGSPGHWYVSDGTPGLGYAFKRCALNNERVDAFFTQLSSSPNQMKDKLGLTGKRLSIRIEDYITGTQYYTYTENLNRPNVYRYERPAVLNSTLVKIVMEVAYS